jgi:hypothetical protein
VQLVGLPVCSSSSTDARQVLNWACHWNTCVRLKIWSPKTSWIIVSISVALFSRLAQTFMRTRPSFLWSIAKIATGHVHDSKQIRVKNAHVHPATCNLVHWLTRHYFALPQLLYRWWHQSRIFSIPPRICKVYVVEPVALHFITDFYVISLHRIMNYTLQGYILKGRKYH